MSQCLFSAPFSFLGPLREEFRALMPTRFQEIWHRQELGMDPSVTAWVVNPGQDFMVDEAALVLLPHLSTLITPSTGTNHIDVAACQRKGVTVLSLLDNRPALDRISASAEFTFLMLLNSFRRLDLALAETTKGRWRSQEDQLRGSQLQGKLVGLVGFGRIGKLLDRYAKSFGAATIYHDPYVPGGSVPLEELFSRSDAVCICCALTPETTGMISAGLLRKLKQGASLINSSRGEVIDEAGLAQVLLARPDLRVGLDVLASETQAAQMKSPLIRFHESGQIFITPHIAGATVESQTQAARGALELLREQMAGVGALKR